MVAACYATDGCSWFSIAALPEFRVCLIVQPRLLGELLRVVLPAFFRVLADNRLHRGIGLDRRRVDAEFLTRQQALAGHHPEDEVKDLVENLLR
jgi:hypothetical protein